MEDTTIKVYEKQQWINNETPITEEKLNHIEQGIYENSQGIYENSQYVNGEKEMKDITVNSINSKTVIKLNDEVIFYE